jgi:hypothetical protein
METQMTATRHPKAGTLRRVCASMLLVAASLSAHAALITFDERARVPGTDWWGDAWYADPITNEYDALGVSINDGYLIGTPGSQQLLGGPSFSVTFTGTLPTYVSLNFSSPIPPGEAWVSASGSGYAVTFGTGGESWSEAENGGVSTPYHPNSFAQFHSEQGILRLDFSTAWSTRNTGLIDNLYFGNVPAIPEPATLALWAAGLGVVAVAKRRSRQAA